MDERAPRRPAGTGQHNLPAQRTSFIGREEECRVVRKQLEHKRLVTLTGVGGCGKTRLALQVATDEVGTFDDGVFLVELAPVSPIGLAYGRSRCGFVHSGRKVSRM